MDAAAHFKVYETCFLLHLHLGYSLSLPPNLNLLLTDIIMFVYRIELDQSQHCNIGPNPM